MRRSASPALMAALLGTVLATAGDAGAADHRDGPRLTDVNNTLAGALDLNDLFIFQGANRNNTVFIQTMSPGAGIVGPGVFFPGAVYDLLISNDGNPLNADEILFRTVFSAPDPSGRQTFQLFQGSDTGIPLRLVAQGTTNSNRFPSIRGGGRVTAGIFDDPFVFDVNAVARLNREATLIGLARAGTLRYQTTPGGPVLTTLPSDIDTNGDGTPDVNPARHLLRPNFPQDFFGGMNTLAIVIEVPRMRVQSSRNNPNITVHMRSFADIGDGRGFAQFDRTALPSLNTVITPLSRTFNREILLNGFQDEFNARVPQNDPQLIPVAVDRLMTVFGMSAAEATTLAGLFLPDVARFNTTSSAGFFNGRKLSDDVIDAELAALTGGALTTDRVNQSSFYRRNFPYIQIPNPITQTLANQIQNRMAGRHDDDD